MLWLASDRSVAGRFALLLSHSHTSLVAADSDCDLLCVIRRSGVSKLRLPCLQGEKRDKKQLFLASDQSLSYLDGSLAGDYGFDPLGLMDPEGAGDEGFISPPWLVYGEIYNGRWAMLGVVGCLFPEVLATFGIIPQSVDEMTWFRSGVYPPAGTRPYWTGTWPIRLAAPHPAALNCSHAPVSSGYLAVEVVSS